MYQKPRPIHEAGASTKAVGTITNQTHQSTHAMAIYPDWVLWKHTVQPAKFRTPSPL